MPSSLICCSEDSPLEPEQLQIKAQGVRAYKREDEQSADLFIFSISELRSFEVTSAPISSFSRGFPPTAAAFASFIDEVDSPPSLESFSWAAFTLSGILRYFLDLKTPGSAGSAAAHQIYRPKTQAI